MAITILNSPVSPTPVRNEIVYTLSSSNTGQSNFKYVMDLYVTGQSTSIRKTRSADLSTGQCWFDVHDALRSYLSYDLPSMTSYGWQTNPNSIVSFTPYFGEQYGPSSGVTTYSGTTVGAKRYAFNGGKDFISFLDYTSSDYVAGSTASKFLTDSPTTLTVRSDENRWLSIMNSASSVIDYMQIKTYSSPNAVGLIQTVNVYNPSSGVTTDASRLMRFSMGGSNLNLIEPSKISSGSQPIMTASVKSYTIQCYSNTAGGTPTSEIRTFNIVDECSKYDRYTFHFLNELGGFDTFSMILASKKDVNIKRDKMKKIVGGITNNAFQYFQYDRQDTVYNIVLTDKITVNSTNIRSDESTWLEQLITSPEVYLENSNGDMIAVNIMQDSYYVKQNLIEKTFNLSFQFEYAYQRTR